MKFEPRSDHNRLFETSDLDLDNIPVQWYAGLMTILKTNENPQAPSNLPEKMFDIKEKLIDSLLIGLGQLHSVVIVVQRVFPGVEQECNPQLPGRILLKHLLQTAAVYTCNILASDAKKSTAKNG
jgi:hypothetical protein